MKKLKIGQIFTLRYGCAAQKVYKLLCDEYGFNINQIGKFGKQQRLFSKRAAPDGNCVLFLVHSNWTNEYKIGNWVDNFIEVSEKKVLEEYNMIPSDIDLMDPSGSRHIFARMGKNKGVFKYLGLFTCNPKTDIDVNTKTRVFKIDDNNTIVEKENKEKK